MESAEANKRERTVNDSLTLIFVPFQCLHKYDALRAPLRGNAPGN